MIARALWQYRGFVRGMVQREFQQRYLNSLLGSAWSILGPAAMIVIYTVVFSRVMRTRLPGVDDAFAYSFYLCAGLLPWTYFTELLTRSVTLFLDNAPLLKKVSFPRSTLPLIALASSTVNFVIIFGLFLLVLAALGRFPGRVVLAFVPLLALQQAMALGLGVLLGVLNVFFRDVAQLVGIALQFWFWLTPIVYSIDILPERARQLFALNPMVPLVAASQHIILESATPAWWALRWHAVGIALLLALALTAFSRLSGEIVDEL